MIFLDNNSTTKPIKEIIDLYKKIMIKSWYNPNADTKYTEIMQQAILDSKKSILYYAGLSSDKYDVIMLNNATTANLLCLLLTGYNSNIGLSKYEHKSIIYNIQKLPFRNIHYIPLKDFQLDIDKIPNNLDFITVMSANNEIPVYNDLQAIKKALEPKTIFHTDATQIFGKQLPSKDYFNGIDVITASAHKFHGPKNVGLLIYNKERVPLLSQLYFGTPCLYSYMSVAYCLSNYTFKRKDAKELRDYLFSSLSGVDFKSLEPKKNIHPFSTLLSFDGMCNLKLKKFLLKKDIITSISSACNTKKEGASHVLVETGLNKYDGIIRVSFSSDTTKKDIDKFVSVLKEALKESEF